MATKTENTFPVNQMLPIRSPPQFNFENSAEWPEWILEFEDYLIASGISEKEEKVQVRMLLYTMGREARKIFASFELSAEDQNKYEVVKAKFDSHFVIRYNEVYESAKFNLRSQKPNETVDQFATALFTLAEHCNFGSLKSRLIRDRFVVGLCDKALSETLQLDPNLTLELAIEKSRQKEAVKLQQKDLVQLNNSTANVDAVKRSFVNKGNVRKFENPKPKVENKCCKYCGNSMHARNMCPANNVICNCCRKKGHFAKVCKTKVKIKKPFPVVSSVIDETKNVEYSVGGIVSKTSKSLHVPVNFNNCFVSFKIDSGAEVSVVGPQTPGVPRNLTVAREILKGPNGARLKVLGKFQTNLCFQNKSSIQTIFVVDSVSEPLLGWPAIEALEIIKIASTVKNTVKDKEFYQTKFPKLFNGLGKMKDTYKIILEPDTEPYSVNVARRVPLPLRKQVKEELDRLEKIGVIRRITKPTKWCAALVPVIKPTGEVRICVDFTKLNKFVAREKTIMPTTEESLGLLGEAKVFTKLDANSGFFQIPLDQESQELTTFITHFGRYCFTRLPFGITSAPEHFQHRMTKILEGLSGVVNQTDDTLIFGKNQEEHDLRLEAVLKRLVDAGVTLNLSKCSFSGTSVKFLGHIVDENGIKPDPSKISAIKNLKSPSDISGVRRILGMVNHVARFIPHLSSITEPLRALLNKNVEFQWCSPQEKALENIKETLSSSQCLAKYHPDYKTVLSADASSFGLGCVLLQKQPSGELRAVAYASRSLTNTETRYSQIEKEALAATWAAERFQQFLLGLRFTLETDHKPLVSLFGKMNIEDLPPRIQRFRIRLMRFDYEIIYVPGEAIATADTLSRSPEVQMPGEEELSDQEVQAYVSFVINSIPASTEKLQEIREELIKDRSCSLVMQYCSDGWPLFSHLPPEVGAFWKSKDDFTISDGLLLKGPRLVIPEKLRKDILKRIHDGHLGIGKCRARAKESVWWPGLSKQIKEMVSCCPDCIRTRHQNAEPLIPSTPPSRPWEKVATDLFDFKSKHYLLVTDYYSRYPEIEQTSSLTSSKIIESLKSVFSRHGIPDVVVSDNGPQYRSAEFKSFALEYGFNHITSSPRYAQSNGEAERMVQTIKNLMDRSQDIYLALLSYRNTPGPTGSSPAQLSMGRRLKTRLPVLPQQLKPKWPNLKRHFKEDVSRKQKEKLSFDRRHATKVLEPLHAGDQVWITDTKTQGTVSSPAETPRSYVVQTPSGETIRRNRRHLVSMPDDPNDLANSSDKGIETPKPDPSKTPPLPGASDNSQSSSPSPDVRRTRCGRTVKTPKRLDL